MDTTLAAAARHFPLLGRPKPACPPLAQRVAEITHIAASAQTHDCEAMRRATHALNKVALLASDCGLPDLARDLCWQHINVYRAVDRPLSVPEAGYMLEPVLNLARLHLRAGRAADAFALLQQMYQAITSHTDLTVDGHTLPLRGLTGARPEHHALRRWAWTTYLADGIRALTAQERWDDAVAHAEQQKGIGLHLMEGRQAVIIAHCLRDEASIARTALDECTLTEPWEQQVGSCLAVMCTRAGGRPAENDTAAMIERFLGDKPVPGYAPLRARLGLAVVTLASGHDPHLAARVLAQVATEACDAGDGYAARDVLGYRINGLPVAESESRRDSLSALVTAAGLDSGAVTNSVLDSITHSTQLAEEALTASVRAS